MSIEEVPKSYVYTCDSPRCCCSPVMIQKGFGRHVQRNAAGHYHEGRPPGWTKVVMLDDNGRADTLLCPTCTREQTGLVNAVRMPIELKRAKEEA